MLVTIYNSISKTWSGSSILTCRELGAWGYWSVYTKFDATCSLWFSGGMYTYLLGTVLHKTRASCILHRNATPRTGADATDESWRAELSSEFPHSVASRLVISRYLRSAMILFTRVWIPAWSKIFGTVFVFFGCRDTLNPREDKLISFCVRTIHIIILINGRRYYCTYIVSM